MYSQFATAFFITILYHTHGGPVSVSVYSAIQHSADDPNLKCPYLRATKLLQPQPDFLSECTSFAEAQSIKKVSEKNVNQGLCLLYYNYFELLCKELNTATEEVVARLLQDVNEVHNMPQNQVCETLILKDNHQFVDTVIPGAAVVQKFIQKGTCSRMCTDFYGNVKPVCSLTGYMMDKTRVYKQAQKVAVPEGKLDKAGSPNKPIVTEREQGSENVGGSKKQQVEPVDSHLTDKVNPNELPAIDNKAGVVYLGDGSHPEEPQGATAQEQVHKSEGNSVLSLWNPPGEQLDSKQPDVLAPAVPIPPIKSRKDDSKHSTAQASPSTKGAPGNSDQPDFAMQDLIEQGLSLQTTRESTGNKPNNENKKDPSLKINQEAKEAKVGGEQQQVNKPEVVVPAPAEKKLENAQSQDQNLAVGDANGVRASDGDAVQGPPPINVDPSKGGVKEEGSVGEAGGDLLSTKKDAEVKPVGESPADAGGQILPEDEEDMDMGPIGGSDAEEYPMNDISPKSSEVKSKPGEKTKPLKTIEDGPSFAANYQNQNIDDSDSYFFSYFMMVCIMFICGYVAYHNKQKILALVVEGRKGRRPSRTRRPNSANYRKLDSNLEEAVTSSCNKNATQVIY